MNKLLAVTVILAFSADGVLADDQNYTVEGLEQPAEIIVDEWGVPHIYANTHYDAFFVQGFNAARDRLWQIDTWRRRGLGLLSEVFGDQYLQQDRATRLFLYRGDMYREWLAYGSDAKTNCQSIYIRRHQRLYRPDCRTILNLLPPEFALLELPARLDWDARRRRQVFEATASR